MCCRYGLFSDLLISLALVLLSSLLLSLLLLVFSCMLWVLFINNNKIQFISINQTIAHNVVGGVVVTSVSYHHHHHQMDEQSKQPSNQRTKQPFPSHPSNQITIAYQQNNWTVLLFSHLSLALLSALTYTIDARLFGLLRWWCQMKTILLEFFSMNLLWYHLNVGDLRLNCGESQWMAD